MELLGQERETLERFLPGLDRALTNAETDLEAAGSGAIGWFREAGGPALLISPGRGGAGAGAWEAVQVQRALGSRSPSLAVATTMHHFSIATLEEMCRAGNGLEGILLRAVAQQRLLVASGFAEGRAGAGILDPLMEGTRTGEGLRVSGRKRPCSLTWSMDLLTASVALRSDGDGSDGAPAGRELAVVLVPADSPGLERRPFWKNSTLAGSESDEVILHDVLVPDRLVFSLGRPEELNPIQTRGFVWFELLIAASYIGVASGIVERLLTQGKGAARERSLLIVEIEGAMAALEGVARRMEDGPTDGLDLPRTLCVRYAVQQALARVGPLAFELLGGLAFVESSAASQWLAASQALAFHPPARLTGFETLAESFAGRPLQLR
jgi:alkylation response protein AidB-like acyl-CoA dehydrogenase